MFPPSRHVSHLWRTLDNGITSKARLAECRYMCRRLHGFPFGSCSRVLQGIQIPTFWYFAYPAVLSAPRKKSRCILVDRLDPEESTYASTCAKSVDRGELRYSVLKWFNRNHRHGLDVCMGLFCNGFTKLQALLQARGGCASCKQRRDGSMDGEQVQEKPVSCTRQATV